MPAIPIGPTSRRARLFRNGSNQAIRIPREFEFEGEEVILRREGNQLIIEPGEKAGLLETLSGLAPLEETFPDVDKGLLTVDSPQI